MSKNTRLIVGFGLSVAAGTILVVGIVMLAMPSCSI